MKNTWQTKKLGEIIKLEYGKPLPKNKRDSTGMFPVYGANGVKDYSSSYYYDRPSIIVGRKGSAGELNLTKDKFWPLDVTYFVTFDENKYDLKFIYLLLSMLNLPSLAKGVKPGINRNDVYSISVNIPDSIQEQKRIIKKIDNIFQKIENLEENCKQKIMDLKELKTSILNEAFAGKL